MKKAKKLKQNLMLMGKSRLLFIIPGFSLGGTTAALASMLNCGLSNIFDIDIFPICRRNYNLRPLISHDIGMNGLTTAFYGDFSQFSTKDKIRFLFIKLLKRDKRLLAKLENWITKRTIKKIEQHKRYNVVVGFQEELATRFTSHFTCPHKIAWIHCDYANAFGKELNELDLYNRFEKIVCVSHFTRLGFISRYPELEEKTIAIHNTFDAKRIVKLSKEALDDHRFDNSQFTIISLGRVHEVKRFYLIPEIATQLKDSGLDFRWYILGSVDIPYEFQRLTDAIQKNGMEKNIIYLGGKANPYPYLKAANLLVTISKSEACPMIFNEAKILHVPVLSADFGSAFEFIEQGKDGYISSIEMLPQKIIELANHSDVMASIKKDDSFCDTNAEILKQLNQMFSDILCNKMAGVEPEKE